MILPQDVLGYSGHPALLPVFSVLKPWQFWQCPEPQHFFNFTQKSDFPLSQPNASSQTPPNAEILGQKVRGISLHFNCEFPVQYGCPVAPTWSRNCGEKQVFIHLFIKNAYYQDCATNTSPHVTVHVHVAFACKQSHNVLLHWQTVNSDNHANANGHLAFSVVTGKLSTRMWCHC